MTFGGYNTGYGEANMANQVWLDYSLARPTDTQLAGAKTFGVCRYLSVVNSLTTKKIIWQAEYDHLLSLGIAIHLNYEWYEGRMSEGFASGEIDGSTALTQAKALGYPRGLPITFSDDTVGTPLAAIEDYLTGVKAGLSGYYRIGYYGPRVKMDAVLISGHAVFGWQPTAWAGTDANGNPIQSKLAHLFQYFGGAPIPQTDLNKVLREPPFAWYVGGSMQVDGFTPAALEVMKNAVWDELINNYVVLAPDPADPTKKVPTQSKARAFVSDVHLNLHRVQDALPTADEIADAVIAKLPANPGGGATPAEVKQAVTDVINATRTVSP